MKTAIRELDKLWNDKESMLAEIVEEMARYDVVKATLQQQVDELKEEQEAIMKAIGVLEENNVN